MKLIILLTHIEDLDGLGAAAILRRFYDQRDEYHYFYYYSLYSNFIDLFCKAIIKDFHRLYITDIGFNDSFLSFFQGTHKFYDKIDYEKIKTKFKKVHWLDHHLISDRDKQFMKILLMDFTQAINNTCASKVVNQYLNKKFDWSDIISSKIAKYANEIDNNKITPTSDRLHRVVVANQDNLWNLYKITDLLSKGKFEDPWFYEQNEKRLKLEKMELDRVLENLKRIKMEGFKIIVSYSEIFTTGAIIKYLYNNMEADIYLSINKNQVSIRSHTLNVRNIALHFDGGGHEYRAGFYYKNILENDKLNLKFIERLKNILQNLKN
jgi:oligoribonuclease NrnB/cAMP/cGMP phosphodiesterase (DHH superfamily)